MIKNILISVGQVLFSISLFSQNVSFKPYEHVVVSSTLKFSIDIPQTWKEIPESEEAGYFQSFIETDSTGAPIKKLCLDSVIYRLKYFSTPIPQAMEKMGFQSRGGDIFQYELNSFIHVVVGFEMKSNNFKGFNCSFKTSLPCEGKKSKKKSNAEMVYLFFSNGTETICLLGNGIPLSESVFEKIENTFKFN